jgi:hypothetical protein
MDAIARDYEKLKKRVDALEQHILRNGLAKDAKTLAFQERIEALEQWRFYITGPVCPACIHRTRT